MPNYKAPRHGVSISEAFHEAASIAPVTKVMLHTFELYHPTLAETIYVVRNHVPLLATKEPEADREPSTEVEFMAAPALTLQRPTESDEAKAGELELAVPNVEGPTTRSLRAARGSSVEWEIIERIFDLSDTGGPAQTPMQLVVTSMQIKNSGVMFRCSYSDPANFAVPRTTYRRKHYPGLTR